MSLSYSLTVSVSLKVGVMFLSLLVREASFWLIIVHNGSQVSFHCFARSPGHAHEDSEAPSLMSNVSCWVSTSSSKYCATISWFITFKQVMGVALWLFWYLLHYLTLKHPTCLMSALKSTSATLSLCLWSKLELLFCFQENTQKCAREVAHWLFTPNVQECVAAISQNGQAEESQRSVKYLLDKYKRAICT